MVGKAVLAALTSRLAGPVATGVALVMLMGLVAQCTAKDAALRQVAQLQRSIDTPVTGWSARLATCGQARDVAVGDLRDQSARVRREAARSAASLRTADAAAAEARKGRARAERNAAGLAELARALGPAAACNDPDLAAVDAAVLGGIR